MIAYTLTDVIVAWPLSFLLGVAIGLGLSSRYRIIRQKSPNGPVP